MVSDDEIRLRVAEIDKKSAFRGWVRIDIEVMKKYKIETGDIVKVKGKKSTAAIVIPAPQEDKGSRIIRMDGLIRINAGTGLGEIVNINKIDVLPANKIVLAPTREGIRINLTSDIIRENLLNRPSIMF